MLQGKVSKALKFINNDSDTKGVHQITDDIEKMLKEKHPQAKPAANDTLLEDTYETPEPVIFEEITAELVQKVAKQIDGSGGPTKVDSDFFQHIVCSKFYGKATENLCIAIADMTKRLATEYVEPEVLHHFVADRFIPLKKEEVKVRPIGIGELLRRIAAKCIATTLKSDIQDAAGLIIKELINVRFIELNTTPRFVCLFLLEFYNLIIYNLLIL